MVNTTGEHPFAVIARVQVKEGMVDEYLEAADACDKAAEASTPGLLIHNSSADPDDPLLVFGIRPNNWVESHQKPSKGDLLTQTI